jgi:hypothetical protein
MCNYVRIREAASATRGRKEERAKASAAKESTDRGTGWSRDIWRYISRASRYSKSIERKGRNVSIGRKLPHNIFISSVQASHTVAPQGFRNRVRALWYIPISLSYYCNATLHNRIVHPTLLRPPIVYPSVVTGVFRFTR